MLNDVRTLVLVDWPSPEFPRALAAAGYSVTSANLMAGTAASNEVVASAEEAEEVEGGASGGTVYPPGPDGGGHLVVRPLAEPPAAADLVVASRPAGEIPAIARFAIRLGARGLWVESGADSPEGRRIAEEAGLSYVDDQPIVDAVRAARS